MSSIFFTGWFDVLLSKALVARLRASVTFVGRYD